MDPGYLYDRRDRVWPSAKELVLQIGRVDSWSYLLALAALGFVGAVVLRRFRLAIFGLLWLALSFLGLVAIYWISTNPVSSHLFNSSDRTIVTLVIGSAMLAPVFLAREPDGSYVPTDLSRFFSYRSQRLQSQPEADH